MHGAGSAALGRSPQIVLLLFAVTLLGFTKSQVVSWADASRMGSIQALVEHGTLALDETNYVYQGDKVRIGGPISEGGHYYSHQPPMLAIIGSIPYWALHRLGWGIEDPGTYKIITLSVVGLPLLLGLLCLARLMRLAGASSSQTAWLLAAASFGTLAFPYGLVLNQHGAAAGFVMAGLLQTQQRRFGWAGMLLSLAATVDLTAAFLASAMLLPIARSGGGRAIFRYGSAAIPVVALHFCINYAIVGDLLPLGLHTEGFEYAGSPFLLRDLTGGSHEGTTISLVSYAFGALLGRSGLFSHHPVLLFALVTATLTLREQYRARGQRPSSTGGPGAPGLAASIDHAVLLGSLAICLYYLTQSRNFGGWAFGMRWFCVFAPALMLLPAVWLGRHAERRLVLGLFAPLLLWSVCAAAVGAIQPWTKLTYRWQDTGYGRAALQRGETVSLLDHAARQLRRATMKHGQFSQHRWEMDFVLLLNSYQRAYLPPSEGMTDESHRTRMAIGLAKLERVVELFEEEGGHSLPRAWAHYWRAHFYLRMGRLEEAERDFERVLELSPDFYRSRLFRRIRRGPPGPAGTRGAQAGER